MINNKEKQKYVAPKMEVLKARVERGFTTSGTTTEAEESPRYTKGDGIGHRFN